MTDTQANGPLSDVQNARLDEELKAVQLGLTRHLRTAGELAEAQDQIAELRVRLAETEAKLKAMYEHNAFLEDRLNLATIDRTLMANQRAEYAVQLDNIRRLLEKPDATP